MLILLTYAPHPSIDDHCKILVPSPFARILWSHKYNFNWGWRQDKITVGLKWWFPKYCESCLHLPSCTILIHPGSINLITTIMDWSIPRCFPTSKYLIQEVYLEHISILLHKFDIWHMYLNHYHWMSPKSIQICSDTKWLKGITFWNPFNYIIYSNIFLIENWDIGMQCKNYP